MPNADSTIKTNSLKVQSLISQALMTKGRKKNDVCLIAVSKTQPFDAIINAYNAGLRHFGENYLQEAIQKIKKLNQLNQFPDICWHFIGHIQSNKSKAVAEHFQWVHTLDRFKLAQRLNQHRPTGLPPLNVLIQVNISQEDTKAGIPPAQLAALAEQVIDLPNLRLRGLMTIGQRNAEQKDTSNTFQALQKSLIFLQEKFENHPRRHHLDALSMGMSNDFPLAIQHGATHVRVGTQIFGARKQVATS